MATKTEGEEDTEIEGLVPYAPDFTPRTLGKEIGEDRVLSFLLEQAGKSRAKAELFSSIESKCLTHVKSPQDRRDMASHVYQGLANYGLVDEGEDGTVLLTEKGRELAAASGWDQDMAFARHILTACHGYLLVEAAIRHQLEEGKPPTLESLAKKLDRSATSKNVSTMRAWLARAGVFRSGGYQVDAAKVDLVLGRDFKRILKLNDAELEFVLAARIAHQARPGVLQAPDVKLLAETRSPEVKLPAKALSVFVRKLAADGFFRLENSVRAKGGTRISFTMNELALETTDSEARRLLVQTRSRFDLSDVRPLSESVTLLNVGNADQQGLAGEMLAIHVCLMLDLTVLNWRHRLPVEVDLIAERSVALSYQRWHIQVKNTAFDLDADRVDREVGAAAGTGATHILFVVPRAALSSPARAEIVAKTRLTHLHIFWLAREAFEPDPQLGPMLRELRGQQAFITRLKRAEAERRQKVATA
jgi:hypothetical protein